MCRVNLFRTAPSFRRFATASVAGAVLLWISANAALAQPGGGRDGGDRGRGFFNPAEMIDRLDANKNGQVDPDEMQGRSRFFLEAIARDNKLDLSQPIPTAKLRDLMQARFQQGGGGGGNRGPSGQGTSTATPASAKPAVADKMAFGIDTSKQPKVPGFGTDLSADSWDVIKAKYDQRVVERVEEMLKRMDKNQDGILDAEEIKSGQWRGDPKESDTNKDGKLTRSELAERQRLRDQNGGGRGGFPGGGFPGGGFQGGGFGGDGFGGGGFNGGPGGGGPSRASVAPPASSSSSTPSASNSSSSNSSSSSSAPVAARPMYVAATPTPVASSPAATSSTSSSSGASAQIAGYADGLLKQYDTNKDGTLQRDEWSQMNSKRQKADVNGDGLITKDEIIAQLSDYAKSSGSSTSSSSSSSAGPSTTVYGGRAVSSRTGAPGTVKTYRFLTPVERLPKGLPDWFTRNDTNGDGQVAMAEFSSTWDDAKTAEFTKWDRNGDGFITPREATTAQ